MTLGAILTNQISTVFSGPPREGLSANLGQWRNLDHWASRRCYLPGASVFLPCFFRLVQCMKLRICWVPSCSMDRLYSLGFETRPLMPLDSSWLTTDLPRGLRRDRKTRENAIGACDLGSNFNEPNQHCFLWATQRRLVGQSGPVAKSRPLGLQKILQGCGFR